MPINKTRTQSKENDKVELKGSTHTLIYNTHVRAAREQDRDRLKSEAKPIKRARIQTSPSKC